MKGDPGSNDEKPEESIGPMGPSGSRRGGDFDIEGKKGMGYCPANHHIHITGIRWDI